MKQEITQAIATGAVTLATSTGILTSVLAYLGSNAAGIGAASTLIFGAIYVFFQYSSNKKLTIAEINKIEIDGLSTEVQSLTVDFKEHKAESNKQFDNLNVKIDTIVDKVVNGLHG